MPLITPSWFGDMERPMLMRAEAMLFSGRDVEAETLCHKALYQGKSQRQTGLCICAELILARIAMLRGDADGYETALISLRQYTTTNPERFVLRMIDLSMATLILTLGGTDGVVEWLYDMEHIKKALFALSMPYGAMLYGKLLLINKRYSELYGLTGPVMGMAAGMNYLLPQVYRSHSPCHCQKRPRANTRSAGKCKPRPCYHTAR